MKNFRTGLVILGLIAFTACQITPSAPPSTNPPTTSPTSTARSVLVSTATSASATEPTTVSAPPPTPVPAVKPAPTATPKPTATRRPTATPRPTPTPVPPYYQAWNGLVNARWLEQNYPTLASEIKSLPWVSDGIDNMESEVVQELLYIAAASRPTVSSIVRLGWVRDGIEEMEVKAIEDISYLSNADPDEALRIVRMQFLASLESSDVAALESLAKLATLNARDFRRVMAHPTLIGGIYDDWGKVVATLYGVSETNPKLIDVLLNPDRVRLNTLAINLPRAGEVELAIIRTDRHMASPYGMDLLEHAVRNIEEFMAAPFPNGYVGLLFGEAVLGGSAGTNYGTHMSILPEYDVDDGSYYAEYAGHIIAHEVAHYYWIGNVGLGR